MGVFQFLSSISWHLIALVTLLFFMFLIVSGRLKWIELHTNNVKSGAHISESVTGKEVTLDNILAFESFLERDFTTIGRGSRLAYVLLFKEKKRLLTRFNNKQCLIELTSKDIEHSEGVNKSDSVRDVSVDKKVI